MGMKRKVFITTVKLKKIIAIVVLSAMITILASGFFVSVYKPYITSVAENKANIFLQQTVNLTVTEVLDRGEYGQFVDILKNQEGRITGIETDTVSINKFKSVLLYELSKKFKSIQNEKFKVPLFSFLNNPMLSEIGPAVTIRVRNLGNLKADLISTFSSVGVNQTKHQIDFKLNTKATIIISATKIEHNISTIVPISQTIIVGEVPQSYTNVEATADKLDDTVLQLAEN